MTDALPVGTCTIILAREGPPDPDQDAALLRDVEDILGVARGAMVRTAAFERGELRLIEGLSRAAADRVAGAAVQRGYTPRVRDRMGIKWSSERGSLGFLGITAVLTLAFALAFSAAPIGAVAGGPMIALGAYLAAMAVAMRWQFSRLYMPLAVPTAVWSGAPIATAEATGDGQRDPIAASAAQARRAIKDLIDAIALEEIPANAAADLERTAGALASRVDRLASTRPDASDAAGLEALRGRLQAVRDRDDPEGVAERTRLEAAIRSEVAAIDASEGRIAEAIRELVALRRAALDARAALHGLNTDDAVARLQREIEALVHPVVAGSGSGKGPKVGEDPGERIRAAAIRARQAQRG